MSLDTSVIDNSALPIANEGTSVAEKPKKKLRAELLSESKLVLTKRLSFTTNVKLNVNVLLWRFKKIELHHTKEHLPEKEEAFFKENIDIDALPIGSMIEIWTQTPGSQEYQVTEYQKLK